MEDVVYNERDQDLGRHKIGNLAITQISGYWEQMLLLLVVGDWGVVEIVLLDLKRYY